MGDFKVVATSSQSARIPLLISTLGPKAFRLAGEISDGALSWMCPLPYLLNEANASLRTGAEAHQRSAPPLVAHMMVVMSTNEAAALAAARQRVQGYTYAEAYARMFARVGFAGAMEGDEAALDALARTLVISGDEATVRSRIYELLASGLDELMLQLIPIADETSEREQLLQVVGTL
jgi:alkanesulfonate monooxygenase SsuD/methylene tetrahydromethanopterin reductase-like flavin-dependent oxidoreductase (luciferase family)